MLNIRLTHPQLHPEGATAAAAAAEGAVSSGIGGGSSSGSCWQQQQQRLGWPARPGPVLLLLHPPLKTIVKSMPKSNEKTQIESTRNARCVNPQASPGSGQEPTKPPGFAVPGSTFTRSTVPGMRYCLDLQFRGWIEDGFAVPRARFQVSHPWRPVMRLGLQVPSGGFTVPATPPK